MIKKLLPAGIALISLLTGIFLGREVFSKKTFSKPATVQASNAIPYSGYNYLNPLLDCIDSKGLNMEELRIFKPKITAYIDKELKQHPDLHISYYFRDMNNGLWIGINEKEMFSPASLMKVPIMITVLKEAQTNKDLLATKVQYIKANFKDVDEESGFEKKDGEFYAVEEYIRQMIAYSDNASALILMQLVGMDKIVVTEKDLNLSVADDSDINTNFVPVNRYSAVFRILYNASYINKEMSEKALGFLTQSVYKGGIRKAVPENIKIAHKYGERDFFDTKGNRNVVQLHHFGIVYVQGKPYTIGVMTRGSDKATKEQIIYDLAKITYDEVSKQIK